MAVHRAQFARFIMLLQVRSKFISLMEPRPGRDIFEIMADGLQDRLRAENASLLSELRDGLVKLQLFTANEKKALFPADDTIRNEKQFRSAKAKVDVRTPLSLVVSNRLVAHPVDEYKRNKRKKHGKRRSKDAAVTSTPIVPRRMLESEGNLRRRFASEVHSPSAPVKTRSLAENQKPKSILVVPDKRKTPKHERPKVFFPTNYIDTRHYSKDSHRTFGEKSMLGYDWIAGILDNESNENVDDSEKLIEEINEFRRVNREECISTRGVLDSTAVEKKFVPVKAAERSADVLEDNDADFCCGSTYTVDSRLLPVPIHGPYSQCPVCLTKPAPESEYSESYIRVSVPRSSLKSPYRLKPHRRMSFDPSDSVALSEHCLAGWQCACPSYIPGHMDNMDIKSSIDSIRKHSLMEVNNLRSLYQSPANEVLDPAIGMRYGLQLLEDTENLNRKVNYTNYSVF